LVDSGKLYSLHKMFLAHSFANARIIKKLVDDGLPEDEAEKLYRAMSRHCAEMSMLLVLSEDVLDTAVTTYPNMSAEIFYNTLRQQIAQTIAQQAAQASQPPQEN